MVHKDFLGHGLSYPFRQGATDFASASGKELVENCINVILDTPQGSLRWKPWFGSKLHTLVWRNNDSVIKTLAQRYTINAIKRAEPRVVVKDKDVQVWIDDNELYIKLSYTIINSNVDGNMVYSRPLKRSA